jgi:D-alanyl-D-alanine-carboxypeptidase/D-alanyl-D-alanine-endopeptidase
LWRFATVALAIALSACTQATTQGPAPKPQPSDLAREAAGGMGTLFADSGAGGMVVAVVRGDDSVIQGYGHMAPGDPRVPDGTSLVRLDSISKLLTSQLLAKLAATHRVALTDALTLHAPTGWAAKTKDATPITLVELATHTAGLPRNPPYSVSVDPPGAPQAMSERWAWIAARGAKPPAQPAAHYSNVGFDLLGDALADATGSSFDDALKAWVTAPLGMRDTTANPAPDQCVRMMAGDPGFAPPPCIDESFQAASGGVYSTAADMGLWMQNQMAAGPPDPARKISQAIYVQRGALARAEGIDVAGPASGIGLAWIQLDPDGGHPRLIEKTGGGYGFMTYIVLDPARRIGVFLAVNKMGGGRLKRLTADANDLTAELGGFRPAQTALADSGAKKATARN